MTLCSCAPEGITTVNVSTVPSGTLAGIVGLVVNAAPDEMTDTERCAVAQVTETLVTLVLLNVPEPLATAQTCAGALGCV